MKKISFYTASFIFLLLSFNCSSSSELINLTTLKNDIIKYHESGEYDKDVQKITDEAKEKFSNITFSDSAAVIFDIDETALSNYEANKEFDFGYIAPLWDKWVEEARATAIRPVKDLYDYLLSKGLKIIFITGRSIEQYDATRKNLVSEGYTTFDTLITRSVSEKDLTALEYKSSKRAELTNRGYKIAGTVGDQWSDLKGEYHGIQVKIPNFIYEIE